MDPTELDTSISKHRLLGNYNLKDVPSNIYIYSTITSPLLVSTQWHTVKSTEQSKPHTNIHKLYYNDFTVGKLSQKKGISINLNDVLQNVFLNLLHH